VLELLNIVPTNCKEEGQNYESVVI